MCGILAIFESKNLTEDQLRKLALQSSKKIRHRGPDWTGMYLYYCDDAEKENGSHTIHNAALAHERLGIVDPESGAQPLYNHDKTLVLAANGEIYNHKKIREDPEVKFDYRTGSDCEVIIPLYEKYGVNCANHLDGMFAFVLWDLNTKSFYAARDHIGIVPLYIGWRADGGVCFSSELKGLHGTCERFEIFPPGHYYSSKTHEFKRWFEPTWIDPNTIPSQPLELVELRQKFEGAVIKRMMSDVPWGVLLSGGLDSSLVSSVAVRHAAQCSQDWPRIHSFSIGLEGSPDLAAAKKVADFLGTKHHGFVFTVQDGLDAISEVIYHLETYDITTIRAATPMLLMARKIKAIGVKMVLSGEGADEALGGYLYFHKAPNKVEFHKETVNKLNGLHYYDCLRANKSMSAFGVEPRVPFLDKDFLEYVMNLDPEVKMCKVREGDEKRGSIEKYIMRKAFDTPENPYLPEEVLWRQKEQFSDGVGYNWIDSLRAKAEDQITATQWATRTKRFPVNTPTTKEGYVYRTIFQQHFPGESARDTVLGGPSVACSTPAAIEWDEAFKAMAAGVGGENSGRAVAGVHASAYDDVVGVVSGAKAANSEPAAKKAKVN
uniref:asparagine synthase (glutamine-hydrolyzing) n=1 Tax=Aplanochytrium stocchinoi TaxID=215587 RepID=A0A7S3LLR2_9STRA|mmetsp:Transcript_1353/g.2077  ORF Transcript_1353/g.2077 Transcript_1353/m.2077 type:complete len:604 (-) Transcript_1353:1278-3089(-)|eukprot:CAMPEP_0204832572 /NCGR_PEP_ID=MMETSP1346-20131115/14206_1 /ASSEMBLY_ACC=CAM_ASM_000771 /TAXON_ID=215587 /ORGANISM="Aplanochytrium stocchinoi, Strain GSBS06" /LENGTH=603 /DNA_ID=CAMNT_0051964489 /DNA_START=110 /DNA_END=1921 /DNA_ORIENTATION=-